MAGMGATALFGSTGCLGSNDQTSRSVTADTTVEMTPARRFKPETVTTSPGESVQWINKSPPLQTVTADEDAIPSQRAYFASGGFKREILAQIGYPLVGALRTGQRFSHTFDQPGTYGYYSIPFETSGMVGTVIVE